MGSSRFIVIEGLIGVGKTSLCRILQDRWGAKLVLEPCEDNPFLAAFYADRDRHAFPAQMFYLATRFAQQQKLLQTDLFENMLVADYIFAKDRLFAEETLSGDELDLYYRFANLLAGGIPKPDFVVFLDAPTDVVISRIQRRAIDSEQVIEASYLDSLRERYYRLWDQYEDAPIYVVDTSEIHYVDNEDHLQYMLDMLTGWLNGQPIAGSPDPYRRTETPQLSLFTG